MGRADQVVSEKQDKEEEKEHVKKVTSYHPLTKA